MEKLVLPVMAALLLVVSAAQDEEAVSVSRSQDGDAVSVSSPVRGGLCRNESCTNQTYLLEDMECVDDLVLQGRANTSISFSSTAGEGLPKLRFVLVNVFPLSGNCREHLSPDVDGESCYYCREHCCTDQ